MIRDELLGPLTFIAFHAAALVALMLAIAAAGTLMSGQHTSVVVRAALGLAVTGQVLLLLAIIGQLNLAMIVGVLFIAMVGGALRLYRVDGRSTSSGQAALPVLHLGLFVPLFLLAVHPPLAFDETLYHLPFVRALADSGTLRFLPELRFPAFPQLQEVLAVPLFLAVGDTATHLLSLAETLITAGLLIEWGRRYAPGAGWLAAAGFLGSPLVIHLATIAHVDAALTLFVTAGFYCLDRARTEQRRWLVFAGLFFGSACSVKYLAGYFAIAAFVCVLGFFRSRKAVLLFLGSCAAAAFPMTLWLILTTKNPVFPFLPAVFGSTPWSWSFPSVSTGTRVTGILRVVWDVTFARERMNFQPPVTPLLALAILIVLAAAFRDTASRCVVLIVAGYLVAFSFLPQDSRYLVATLPLLSVVAAVVVARQWPARARWMSFIAVAPGLAYVFWRLWVIGMPPMTPHDREKVLTREIPEYRALRRAGEETVYVCGAEQLKYYAEGRLLGDFVGPYSYARVLEGVRGTEGIAANLRRVGASYFLVARRVCEPPIANGGMGLVYQDGAAQLWRVMPADPTLDRERHAPAPPPPASP